MKLEKPKKKLSASTIRKKLAKRLDDLQREVLRRLEPVCVICGSDKQLGVGHIFTRRALSTRWEVSLEGNCHIQCWSCNFRHVRDQYPYFNWYINKFGLEKFNELRAKHKAMVDLKNHDLQALISQLEGK